MILSVLVLAVLSLLVGFVISQDSLSLLLLVETVVSLLISLVESCGCLRLCVGQASCQRVPRLVPQHVMICLQLVVKALFHYFINFVRACLRASASRSTHLAPSSSSCLTRAFYTASILIAPSSTIFSAHLFFCSSFDLGRRPIWCSG